MGKIKGLDTRLMRFYNGTQPKIQAYIEFRCQGYTKTDSYIYAGFRSKYAGQAANNLENRNPEIQEIVEAMNTRKSLSIDNPESAVSKKLDAIVESDEYKKALEKVENATGEVAEQIQFYRDIIQGKTKVLKKVIDKDANGVIIKIKEEYVEPSISERMEARKRYDSIIGLSQSAKTIGTIEAGEITINIVHSKKEDEENPMKSNAINAEEVEVVSEVQA